MPTSASSWLDKEAPGTTSFDKVFGLLPETYAYYHDFYAVVWDGPVNPALIELCRLRIAQLLECEPELRIRYQQAVDAGLTDEKVAALSRYYDSPLYDSLEREAVSYAETFVIDPRSITDEQAAGLKAALTSDGLAQLTVALALFDGFSRFKVFLGIQPDHDNVTTVPKPLAGTASLP